MAYIIRKTNGQTLGTILDGTVDTAQTSLTLVGRNYSNYGQIMTDNLVALLENFAYDIEPNDPLPGQLWWDTSANLLKVYTGTYFKIISSATAQNSNTVGAPTTVVSGDIWWDTYAEQLYVYDGTTPYVTTGWKLVGPVWSKVNGKSGALWEQIIDTGSVTHNVVSLYIDGTRTAIINQDSEFTPQTAITGFTTIKTGHNLRSSQTLWGTANNASFLGGVVASNYLRTDIDNGATGNLRIVNDSGITLGASLDLTLSVSGADALITNNTTDGNISLVTNSTVYLHVDAAAGTIEVATDPSTSMGIATKNYVDDSFVDATLTGISTAITMPVNTANTAIATTEFVVNNSGFLKNKIYQGNSYLEIIDSVTGSANLAIDGTTVMTASASGVNLTAGATAATQSQTYVSTGNAAVATTQYVRTAGTWWDGSAKFVSTDAPLAGANDSGSNDGDFWFQYTP
jgi:hypothetical protein